MIILSPDIASFQTTVSGTRFPDNAIIPSRVNGRKQIRA
jgi:hypothetical protein